MENKLVELIDLVKHLPERSLEKAIEVLTEIKKQAEKEEEKKPLKCLHCQSDRVVRNGFMRGKQNHLCRNCGKSFVATVGTVAYYSHSGEAVWKQVIRDTVNGVAIDKTAEDLCLHHETVFNMRHKILFCLEQEEVANPTVFSGVCEADETYLLENYKGKGLPDYIHREARKHGAVAQKRGISNEYICICAAIERGGAAFSTAVNRAAPDKNEIHSVFAGRVDENTLVLCDGAKEYNILEEKCGCSTVNADKESDGFYNINSVNGYHSFIKERNRMARGFATKYLNRYNALFSTIYKNSRFIIDDIYRLLFDGGDQYITILASQNDNLLQI